MYTKIYPVSSIPDDLIDIIKNDMAEAERLKFHDYFDIYYEQLHYIKSALAESYLVASYDLLDKYLGGTFLFLDKLPEGVNPDPPVFQGIVKSLYARQLPVKLNSLLIPAIIKFLRNKSYSEVRVEHLDNQRKILIKYYGFQPMNFGELLLQFGDENKQID